MKYIVINLKLANIREIANRKALYKRFSTFSLKLS